MSGTGFSEILFDEKIYTEKFETMSVNREEDEFTNEVISTLDEGNDDYCAQDNFGFNFDMQHLNAETLTEQLPSVNISLKTEKK